MTGFGTRRRYLLALGTVGLTTLAGCPADSGTDDDGDDESGDDEPEPPDVEFEYEFVSAMTADYETGVLTITHAGGDTVPADQLTLTGEGFTAVDGVDPHVTSEGRTWTAAGGGASGDADGSPGVIAGDRITVGVVEDHDVDVVWRSADGSVSEVLPVERSREQSGEQVTNRLQVLTASGVKTANDGAEAIGVVELISTKAPGADDIDLTGATMQWVDDSATYDLVHHEAFDEANHDGAFGVAPIKDADGSLRDADRINDPDDRVRLVVDLGEFDDASQDEFTDAVTAAVPIRESGLGEGATAQMRITTASGAATTMRLTVPVSLADREAVSL